jgi:hypothetical protein
MPEAARAAIDRFLEANAHDLQLIGRTEHAWDVLVPSYWKETIAVSINLHDARLRCDAFFLRAPDERRDEAYTLLLRRNVRAYLWKFAVNDDGDVSLTCEVPLRSLDSDVLDRLFGTLITLVDETYVPYMKIAFGTALDEQIARGGPGLDRPPWADRWESGPDAKSGN